MESRCNQNEDCMDSDGEGFDESDCRVVYLDEKQYRFEDLRPFSGYYKTIKIGVRMRIWVFTNFIKLANCLLVET